MCVCVDCTSVSLLFFYFLLRVDCTIFFLNLHLDGKETKEYVKEYHQWRREKKKNCQVDSTVIVTSGAVDIFFSLLYLTTVRIARSLHLKIGAQHNG